MPDEVAATRTVAAPEPLADVHPQAAAQRPELVGHPGLTMALLVTLAAMSAIAPFATDLYLPAFPDMVADLSTTATGVQLTLTTFLLGLAVGQLVFGPVSDRFGRVAPLLTGSVLCVVASIGAALAPNVEVLIGMRLLQGFTAAAGMVISRAIVSDIAEGATAAKAFGIMMAVGGVAPVIAPLCGSVITGIGDWRTALWTVAGLTLLLFIATKLVVVETHTPARREHSAQHHARHGSPLKALADRGYIGYTLVLAFGFAVLMAYISASPFVFQNLIGMNTTVYALCFGGIALSMTVTSGLSAKLASTHSTAAVVRNSLLVLVVATVVLVALVLSGVTSALLVLPVLVAVASLGFVLGNSSSLAIGAVPQAAGVGSAVLGALQSGAGAVVAPLVSVSGEETAVPFAVVMCTAAVLALVLALVAGSGRGARA